MGFNKRYINKKTLLTFNKRSLQELVTYIKNPDCLIIEDEWSSKVCDIVNTTNEKFLQTKLNEIGFYGSK